METERTWLFAVTNLDGAGVRLPWEDRVKLGCGREDDREDRDGVEDKYVEV